VDKKYCSCGHNITVNNDNYCDECWNLLLRSKLHLIKFNLKMGENRCFNCNDLMDESILCNSCYGKNLPITHYGCKFKGIYYIL